MSTQNILNLAKKLKALADQGVDGEKENASAMLKRIMQKHGITAEQLGEDTLTERSFTIQRDQCKFFQQLLASVIGVKRGWQSYKREPKRNFKTYFVDLTDAEFIEVDAKFDFFWKAYERDLNTFYSAFIQRNKLYAKPEENDDEKPDKPMTAEEKEELWRMMNMMEGLKPHQFTKQLQR